jgi:transposase
MSGYDQDKSFTIVAETRRKWSRAEKAAVVAETGGSSVSSVARRHGIASSLVFRWRRELGGDGKKAKREAEAAFVPVALPAPVTMPVAAAMPGGGLIEIELSGGRRVRVDASFDVNALKRVIAVLDGR